MTFEKASAAVPCTSLLPVYEAEKTVRNSRKLNFSGVDGYDVYNISPAFEWKGETYIAGRVEKRENELSHVRIFKKVGVTDYEAILPELRFEFLQDPFVCRVGDELVLGGVLVTTDPLKKERIITWQTVFYRGRTLEELHYFAMGPMHMKDIRLTQMPDGRIAVFTRPQGRLGGRGKIGFIMLNSLDELYADRLLEAKIYDTHFIPEDWGGANEIHVLSDTLLGVVGHIACRDEKNHLHYHSMTFVFDIETGEHSPVKILAARKDISSSKEAKRPDLMDVLFTGGLVRRGDGTATLYTGVSDCEAWCAEVDDPFDEFMK